MKNAIPHLDNKPAFEEALKNYEASDRAKAILARTPFIALIGLAGSGRNTIIRQLVAEGPYLFTVSDTTRSPKFRDGRMEQDGVNYYFRPETEMLRDIQAGEFAEAEVIHDQQVSGTSIREVERAIAAGKTPISDFEYKGADIVARAKPDADVIGVLPPDYDAWMRRLNGRETMQPQEFRNRMVTAKHVLENMLTKPYVKFVINDRIDDCVADIRRIVEHHNYPSEMHERGLAVAKTILQQVNDTLADQAS